MTSEHQQKTQKSNGRDPDLIVYTVQSRGDDKSGIWTRLGAGWKHKDGKGYDLQCQAYPVDGRLTVRFFDKARAAENETPEVMTPDNQPS